MKPLAALFLLAIPLLFAGCDHDDYNNNGNYRGAYGAPPPAVQYDAARMGHQDGMNAGYEDLRDGRRPDPRRHGEFRRPPVNGRDGDEYRRAYADGYNDAFRRGGAYGRDNDDRR